MYWFSSFYQYNVWVPYILHFCTVLTRVYLIQITRIFKFRLVFCNPTVTSNIQHLCTDKNRLIIFQKHRAVVFNFLTCRAEEDNMSNTSTYYSTSSGDRIFGGVWKLAHQDLYNLFRYRRVLLSDQFKVSLGWRLKQLMSTSGYYQKLALTVKYLIPEASFRYLPHFNMGAGFLELNLSYVG